jgi:hypothetical protein
MIGRAHLAFAGHVAIEFLLGVALALSPLVFDFPEGPTIAAVTLGVIIATIAISTNIRGQAISAHHGWDRGIVIVLIATAVVSAIIDPGVETAVFAAAAVCEAILLAVTRYRPEPR